MRICRRAGLILMLAVTGCEDPLIDPFVEGKHFTVYGYLDPFETDHFVRVIAVRRYPEIIEAPGVPHAEIDAEVTSTNLSTGATQRWTHSLRRLDDGSYGHVFSASFLVTRGVRYRLTIHRSDGAESFAETTVPGRMEAEALPSTVEEDEVTQSIRWRNVPNVNDVVLVYCAAPMGITACSDGADGGGYLVPYGRSGRRVGNDWEINVELGRDFEAMRDAASLDQGLPLQLNSLQMRISGMDSNWAVYDDPYVFAQPTALHNVENGFGYWGSFSNGLFEWIPDDQALRQLGIVTTN